MSCAAGLEGNTRQTRRGVNRTPWHDIPPHQQITLKRERVRHLLVCIWCSGEAPLIFKYSAFPLETHLFMTFALASFRRATPLIFLHRTICSRLRSLVSRASELRDRDRTSQGGPHARLGCHGLSVRPSRGRRDPVACPTRNSTRRGRTFPVVRETRRCCRSRTAGNRAIAPPLLPVARASVGLVTTALRKHANRCARISGEQPRATLYYFLLLVLWR